MTVVYCPVPPDDISQLRVSTWPTSLEGIVVGLLGNWKPGADVLLKEFGRLLTERGVGRVVFREKHSYTVSAPIPLLDELAAECDVVLTAMGDCGSCTSWCVNDAIELQKRGTPALAFVTTPFKALARMELESSGIAGMALGEIRRYPFGGLSEHEIQHEARAVFEEVLAVLTRQSEISPLSVS